MRSRFVKGGLKGGLKTALYIVLPATLMAQVPSPRAQSPRDITGYWCRW